MMSAPLRRLIYLMRLESERLRTPMSLQEIRFIISGVNPSLCLEFDEWLAREFPL